jgi:predicted PurR-regulated permease PerM
MLASALYPIVQILNKKLPFTLSAVLTVLTLLLPLVIIGVAVIPNLIRQFPEIVSSVNKAVNTSTFLPENLKDVDVAKYADKAGSYLLASLSKIPSVITTFLTLLFLTLYLIIDYKGLKKIFADMIPDEEEPRLEKFFETLAKINGQYIRGNLLISLICGIIIFIGLTVLKVPYSGSLALFAGILDLLPLIGAFIGAAPAIILGFTVSSTTGILVTVLFIIYQQFENNILSPNIYNKALDLSPALGFLAVIIGTSLFGIVGAFISLPIAASIPTMIRYMKNK